jgi:hypothetical protein
MKSFTFRALVVGAALALPACSFSSNALWPSLTGEDPATPAASAQTPPPPTQIRPAGAAPVTQVSQSPALGTGDFTPSGVTPGAPTGTFVGKQVIDYRTQLQNLHKDLGDHNRQLQEMRTKIVQDSQRYHGTVAAINARLQVGTTPGNPILVQQYNSAQTDLDRLSVDVDALNRLGTSVAGDATLSAYLAEATQAAFSLSGAVDEDHAQLRVLQDEVNRTSVLIERLLKELTEDVRRQTTYIAAERSNLNMLAAGIKSGEIYGSSLGNQAMASATSMTNASAGGPMDTTGRRPLVVIRFDRDNVPYQQALYNAVSQVLERRPNAVFDLVAVAPTAGGEANQALNATRARRTADNVLRSLVEMGLPPSRVALSGKTSAEAQTNEVHLYLR